MSAGLPIAEPSQEHAKNMRHVRYDTRQYMVSWVGLRDQIARNRGQPVHGPNKRWARKGNLASGVLVVKGNGRVAIPSLNKSPAIDQQARCHVRGTADCAWGE